MSLQIKGGTVLVRAPLWVTDRDINAFVRDNTEWIKKHMAIARARESACASVEKLTMDQLRALADRALTVIPARVKYYASLMGVTYGRITIRNQRTKWGSCTGKGNLNFNCLLMLAPPEVLDSIIVHELCHRKEMNHSDRFYAEVLRVFPDYRKWEKWLKDNGSMLMARMPE